MNLSLVDLKKEYQNYIRRIKDKMHSSLGAIASLNEKNMPELICPNCGAEFEYKKT